MTKRRARRRLRPPFAVDPIPTRTLKKYPKIDQLPNRLSPHPISPPRAPTSKSDLKRKRKMSGASTSGFSSVFPMATVAGHLSLDDIAGAAADRDPNYQTPILRLLSTSKDKGYDTVCIPLTNEKWQARWKEMCLSPEDEAAKNVGVERLSEAWRSNPGFLREEVNVTRLGACAEPSKFTLALISVGRRG